MKNTMIFLVLFVGIMLVMSSTAFAKGSGSGKYDDDKDWDDDWDDSDISSSSSRSRNDDFRIVMPWFVEIRSLSESPRGMMFEYHDMVEDVLEDGTYDDLMSLREQISVNIMPWIDDLESFETAYAMPEFMEEMHGDKYKSSFG